MLGHATIARAIEPIGVATGEHCQNRIVFKQLLQAGAIDFCQIDACRLGGVNEVVAVLLLAAKFGVPVCPHAGGVGLCELVQHLSAFDYVAVGASWEGRVVEFVDHLHEHFVDPCVVRDGRYRAPAAPGYSSEMYAESRERHAFPTGRVGRGGDAAMSDGFDGLRALVTGGASGIGEAAARTLASRGARVAVLDRDLSGVGDPFVGVQADVTDDAAVRAAVEEAAQRLGGLDVLVNNAGIGAQGTVADNADDEWRRVFDVNVFGIMRVARAALPYLRESEHAAICNTSSIAATAGIPQRALYSATKGAILSLTLAMAADHVREGIRVNCVNPGTADTPWVQGLLAKADDPEAERAALEARQPIGRMVSADEVAEAIAYLVSPAAASTTGTSLAPDGGMQGLRLRPE